MNHNIEDLRKKAWVLYGGQEGVERVNWEVRNAGVNEDNISPKMEKYLLNKIIKNVFIEYVGMERTREILAQDIKHLRGYHVGESKSDQESKIRILEKFNFKKLVLLILALGFAAVLGFIWFYISAFDPLEACESRKDTQVRDNCFMIVAVDRMNVTVCDRIVLENARYNCYSRIGRSMNSTDICLMIPSHDIELIDLRQRCIMCVAFDTNSLRTCRLMDNPGKQAECESQIERGRSLIC